MKTKKEPYFSILSSFILWLSYWFVADRGLLLAVNGTFGIIVIVAVKPKKSRKCCGKKE